MSSNVPQSGHGASPFTGPNQVLVSNSLNGERTIFDLNSVPVGSLLGRTATGIGVYPTTGGGGGPTALTLDDLTDVRTTSPEPTVGQVLTYDGTEWVPDDPAGGASTFPDGTVSAPGIAFTDELGTGFFRNGTSLHAAVEGVRAMEVAIEDAGDGTLGYTSLGVLSSAGDKSVAVGYNAQANVFESISIGVDAVVSEQGSMAIGPRCSCAGEGCISIGPDASATAAAQSSTVIGPASEVRHLSAIVIGNASFSVGTASVIIGSSAGSASSSGAGTVGIGRDVLDGTMINSPTGIVAIGDGALSGNLGAAACNTVAVGSRALAAMNGTATQNTALGFEAGDGITTAAQCVFVGASADGAVAGFSQTAVGALSSTVATATCVGAECTSTGTSSAALGHLATITAASSVALGASAIVSAANGVAIGRAASASAAGAIAIGRNNAGTAASATVINGLAFPTTLAQVAPGLAVQFNAGAMGPTTSSIRYKKDVTLAPFTADVSGELKPFDNIRVVEYDSKVDGDNNRYLGIIAEELVDLVHPSLIPRDVEGNPVGISYDRLVCVAIQEIQLLRRRVAALEGAPLPNLEVYTPIDASKLYDNDQIDNETLTAQKQQYRLRARQLRIDRVVERIENNPSRESAILNKLNKATRDAVRKAMEDKATAEAAREAALAQAETARLAAEAQREAAERDARLDALARKKMAANVDLETVGPKMKARIEALLEKDRLALEVATAARLEAQAAQIAAEEEERRLEEEAENDE